MTDPGLVGLDSCAACLTIQTPPHHHHPLPLHQQLPREPNLRPGLGQGGAAVRRGPEALGPLRRPPVPALRPPLWEVGRGGGIHRLLPLHPRSAFQGKYLLSRALAVDDCGSAALILSFPLFLFISSCGSES